VTLTCSVIFFFSSRRRHTRFSRDWSSDVCSSDLSRSASFRYGPSEQEVSSVVLPAGRGIRGNPPSITRRETERRAEPPHVLHRTVQERNLGPRRLVARRCHLRPSAPIQLRAPVTPARYRVAVGEESVSIDLREHADRGERAREPAVLLSGHLAPRRGFAEPRRARWRLRRGIWHTLVPVTTVCPPEFQNFDRSRWTASHVKNSCLEF